MLKVCGGAPRLWHPSLAVERLSFPSQSLLHSESYIHEHLLLKGLPNSSSHYTVRSSNQE